LRLLFWETTAACNLRCVHCRRLEAGQADAGQLTTGEGRALLDATAAMGRPLIIFSGGEPLLRPDWQELAAHARSLSLPAALATNGTLIDRPTAERIAAAGFRRVAVSLDGADAATHDRFRGAPGLFDRAVAGVAELRRCGQAVQINATIAAHNADQLDGLCRLARSIGAEALHLFLLVPVGCGASLPADRRLDADRCERVLHWVCDRRPDASLELRATCAPHLHRAAAQRGRRLRSPRGCLCGVSVLFVSHDGEVFPCGYLPVSCGSVRRNGLADIWRDSPVLADLRDVDRLKGRCGRCEYRTVCGGCRARAYAATGDYLAAEPNCSHTPAG
jgi:radical SAM protein with 4Fe4S-binding SPASM domain